MTIHKEGTASLIISAIILTLLYSIVKYFTPEQDILHNVIFGICLFFFLVVLQFFRKPTRKTPINPNHIIAPADGKVVVIEEVIETEYFNGPRRQVSIFMSPINVHVTRYAVSGLVKYSKYHPGKFLVAWHPKASTENERTTVVIENKVFGEILYRQIAGALAKRIVNYAVEGTQVTQGDDAGFIKFGSRVDIFFPLGTKINVKLNEKAVGNRTIVATKS